MRIVGVNQVGRQPHHQPRQPPRCREVDLTARRDWNQIVPLAHPPEQLSIGMRDEHRAMADGPQALDDMQDLALAAHALKSSSGSVGAKRMYATASELERAALSGRLDGAFAAIEQLAAEFPRVMAAYDGIIRRSGKHRAAD